MSEQRKRESFTSRLVGWVIIYFMAFVALYLLGEIFGIVPESVKTFVGWFDQNFTFLSLLFCYTLGIFLLMYAVRKSSNSRRHSN